MSVPGSASPIEEAATLRALIGELKVVITFGLGYPLLSTKRLPTLKLVAAHLCDQEAQAIEAQIEQAVKPSIPRLGERFGEAAALVFGTAETSARLRKVRDRRDLAADRCGVSQDTFYREYEPRICQLIAKDLLTRFHGTAPATSLHAAEVSYPPGTLAVLDEPTAMALDPVERRLFVVERGKHRVVQVGLVDGIVTPVAGIGERGFSGDGMDARLAKFNRPDGVAFDLDRQLLYIADTDNHRVRRVHLPTGQITTVAGTGRLWPGSRVRSYVPIWASGHATRAKLAFPRGLALNGDGTQVFIATPGSSTVRVLLPAKGSMDVLAGTGRLADAGDGRRRRRISLAVPIRLAFDVERNLLYVSQERSPAVRYFGFSYSKEVVQTVPGTDPVTRPAGREEVFQNNLGHSVIALDQSQNCLYINASPGIACVSLPDGPRSMVAGTDELGSIKDMLFDSTDNALYVSGQHRVVRVELL